MPKRTWLLLDCNYLCHRAHHVFGKLSTRGGAATGVVYGVLKDIQILMDQHGTDNVAFCFDHGKGIRETKVPTYKESRRNRVFTDEEQTAYKNLREQIDLLKKDYLPERLGLKNVFYESGYEADDVIASLVKGLSDKEEVVVVSADKDLFQLVWHNVSIWNPTSKKMTTYRSFLDEYGVDPMAWGNVKALAGCISDDVKGVDGIGEKTAAKFFTKTLPKKHKTYAAAKEFVKTDQFKTNLLLTTLPFPGTPLFHLRTERIDPRKWKSLTTELEMSSLTDKAPKKVVPASDKSLKEVFKGFV